MLFIPVGSDAELRHQPIVTFVLVGLFIVATASVWIAHPRAILGGIGTLIQDEISTRDAAKLAAEIAADEEAFKQDIAAGHPTPHSLVHSLGIAGDRREPRGAQQLATEKEQLSEALASKWITPAEKADLDQRLAACPVLGAAAGMAHEFEIDGDRHGRKDLDERTRIQRHISQAQDGGEITAAEADDLRARLQRCPPAGDNYFLFRSEIGEDSRKPMSVEEVQQMDMKIDMARKEDHLNPGEPEELRALMAKRGAASGAVAERTVESVDDVPWYLAPVGAWSNPLRWLVALCVQPRWSDALLGIGLTLSYGVVVEGIIGWRLFLPVLGGGVVLVCLWNQLTGLMLDRVMVHAGSAELRAFLAGMLLLWVPSNVINYLHWFIMPISNHAVPIWRIVAVGTGLGLLGGVFSGLPLMIAVPGQLLFPAAGLAAGFVLLRKGVIPADAWTLPLLWQTRHMNPGDRSALLRERQLAVEPAAGVPAADRAPAAAARSAPAAGDADAAAHAAAHGALTTEAESEIGASLKAGELDTALWMWKATRTSNPGWNQPYPLLDQLLKACHQAKRGKDAATVAEELVRLHPDRSRDARLVLTGQALAERKPAAARQHLEAIPQAQRVPAAAVQIERLMGKVRELEAQGVREVEFI